MFKDGGRQDKCHHISKTVSHRAILLTLLDSLVDSDVNGSIVDLHQTLNYRHSFKWRLSIPIISVSQEIRYSIF